MTFGSRRPFGGPGLRGLGYTVTSSPPYFTPDPEKFGTGNVNGIPTTAMLLDSSMQQYLSSDVQRISNSQPPNGGTSASNIQSDYRMAAANYCNSSYGAIGCAGVSPNSVADTYSAMLLEIAQTIPAPYYATSYGTMYNYLFNGGYALAQSGATEKTGQLPSPVVTPAASAPVSQPAITPSVPFGTTAVVATTPAAQVAAQTSQTQTTVVPDSSTTSTDSTDSSLSTTNLLLIAAGVAVLFFMGKK